MDWRYNSIWFEQLDTNNVFHRNYQENPNTDLNFEDVEYAMTFHFKHKGLSFDPLPKSSRLLYLEMDWANFKDLQGIDRFENLKRLELHYCIKLENDLNISSLKNTLEFLHINQSKKYIPTEELFQLTNLKVLCLNACGPLENLNFLKHFPNLIDFRFVNTNIIDGDLSPIIEHPTIRNVGFLNKRHYNYTDKQIETQLGLKSTEEYKDIVYKGKYSTFKYKNYKADT